jgi:hypothetical protein
MTKCYAGAVDRAKLDKVIENMINDGYQINGEIENASVLTVNGEYVNAFFVEMKKNDNI